MRSWKLSCVVILAAGAFSACGPAGQPRIYRVALDVTPVRTLADASCFAGSVVTTDTLSEQSFRQEANWVVWDGAEQKQFLDMGTNTRFSLGDAPRIDIDNLIEGSDNVFSAVRRRTSPTRTAGQVLDIEITSAITTFSDLGSTPTGTVLLTSEYQCQDRAGHCDGEPFKRTCRGITMNFWARRIETNQLTVYSAEGSSIVVDQAL
jgi:hypothetical protein